MEMTDDERKEYEAWKSSKSSITKIEVKPDHVPDLPKKEKKPRTEKQIEATNRMREGLAKRRIEGNDKKREHTEAFQKVMSVAQDRADEIKKVLPDAKVVVKTRAGRPRGTKNPPIDPTPAQSESESENDEPRKPVKPTKSKPVDIQPTRKLTSVQEYLMRLNGHE
jgi:hypothetical protein